MRFKYPRIIESARSRTTRNLEPKLPLFNILQSCVTSHLLYGEVFTYGRFHLYPVIFCYR